ncbi:hypothetical protein ACF073_23745 [Streptomyces sp. NPDC015171]|uniref:hypothetical protein n=1 Tax=Streptomyces sp. NPDC015171 TaxID=3364945 RepID=UPI0036F78828
MRRGDPTGHTDAGNAYVRMPAMSELRDRVTREEGYAEPVPPGAAGGTGTPQAALAAFALRADFIVTGSANQCTVEAATSAKRQGPAGPRGPDHRTR